MHFLSPIRITNPHHIRTGRDLSLQNKYNETPFLSSIGIINRNHQSESSIGITYGQVATCPYKINTMKHHFYHQSASSICIINTHHQSASPIRIINPNHVRTGRDLSLHFINKKMLQSCLITTKKKHFLSRYNSLFT